MIDRPAAPIPRTFHFVFGLKRQWARFHLLHYLCLESCRRTQRPDRIYFHYKHLPHGRYWDRIKQHLTLVKVELDPVVQKFRYQEKGIRPFRYAHHADFIRLDVLLEHGGVYADMDTLFVARYPDALHDKPFVLGREDDIVQAQDGSSTPSLCNAVIMSTKESPFAQAWLDGMRDAFDGSWSNHSTVLPWTLSQRHREWIHIEPPSSFYPCMWTIEDLAALFESDRDVRAGCYSIHQWSHLWWSRRRRDFSNMHAGMFTERYIVNVDTTFNRLARRFL